MPTPPRAAARRDSRRARTTLVLLVLATLALISVDLTGAGSPMRDAAGTVLGPIEVGVSRAVSPIGAIGDYTSSRHRLRHENDRLRTENARLRAEVSTTGLDRSRLADYDRLAEFTTAAGFTAVDAHVVGVGSAQSFRRTVTIDAGTSRGVRRDMTVLAPAGLVGRVLSSTRTTSTVLLAIDKDSVVGARLGTDNELGLLRGDGSISGDGRLTLTTADAREVPRAGDVVVSWGSRKGVPYVAGVPIGRVETVSAVPRAQTARVTVVPSVDFSSLDLVAVVVAAKR